MPKKQDQTDGDQKKARQKRRAHGEGSVSLRTDGRWQAQMVLENGKRKYFYGETKKEALDKLHKAQHELRQGTLATGKAQTLNTYLNHWLEQAHKLSVRSSSHVTYRGLLNNHILPALGHIQIQKLTPQHVQAFYNQELESGLSPNTVIMCHSLLHAALKNAVRWNIVSRNVCDLVTKPRKERFKIQPLTEAQAKRFLEVVQGTPLEGIITMTLALGLRRGEVSGLKWEDIDFEEKSVAVQRTVGRIGTLGVKENDPKTASGKRKIMLPDFLLEMLKRHQVRQLERRREVGAGWKNSGYVFCNSIGGFLHESNLHKMYKRMLKLADLPDIRFHDLRHSAATIMFSMGVNPKVVQEMLGHSDISMTLGVYGHVLPSMQQDATKKLDTLFGSPDPA